MKINLIKKLIVTTIVLLISGMANLNTVLAGEPPAIGGKYDRGITRISWWIDYSSGVGSYETNLKNAVNNWTNPGWPNPIKFVAASSNVGTMMDVYGKTDSWFVSIGGKPNQVFAATSWWNYNGTQQSPTINYRFTKVYINKTTMPGRSAAERQGTLAHEIGHTMGLDENNSDRYSIMCQSGSLRLVQTVQKVDNSAIVKLYK